MLSNLQAGSLKSRVLLLAILMSLLAQVPVQVTAQQLSPPATQSSELEEANRLSQQVGELYKQGKYNEAIPLAERALSIRQKVLGPEHPAVALSLNSLAELYRNQGKYEKAEPLYVQALTILENSLGPEHPNTITVRENYNDFLKRKKKK